MRPHHANFEAVVRERRSVFAQKRVRTFGHEHTEVRPNCFGMLGLGTGQLVLWTCTEPRPKFRIHSSKFMSTARPDSTVRLTLDLDDYLPSPDQPSCPRLLGEPPANYVRYHLDTKTASFRWHLVHFGNLRRSCMVKTSWRAA
jgi:hypothetical protein